jgi:hypothetical protein
VSFVDPVLRSIEAVHRCDRDQAAWSAIGAVKAFLEMGHAAEAQQVIAHLETLDAPPPCPSWCVADHDQDHADDAVRLHTSTETRVPVLATEGVESTEHTASVRVGLVDDLTTGTRHPAAVLVSGAADRELSPGSALRLADALRTAVDVIEGHCTQFGGVR